MKRIIILESFKCTFTVEQNPRGRDPESLLLIQVTILRDFVFSSIHPSLMTPPAPHWVMCVWTDSDTDTQRQRHRETETDRDTDTQRDRDTDRQRRRQRGPAVCTW